MKNKKLKIGIISILAIIIILFAMLLVLLKKAKKIEPPSNNVNEEQASQVEVLVDSKLKNEPNRNNYYTAKICAEKFLYYYMDLFKKPDIAEEFASPEDTQKYQNQAKQLVYSLLDEDYINFKQVTKENISEKLSKVDDSNILVNNIKVSQKEQNKAYYFVEGSLIAKSSLKATPFNIMLKIDMLNRTFTVYLEDYIISKKYNELKIGEEPNLPEIETIENKEYNIFDYQSVSDNDHVTNLFSHYKNNTLDNTKQAYNYLNEEYAKNKFGSEANFEKYVSNNYTNIYVAKLEKFEKTVTDEYTQYICIDQKGKYYIFRETVPMQYTAILDTYTIDLPEFVTKYEKANTENKILMNIQKVFDAIEDGDYAYFYKKLDTTFRTNNFKTQEDFEKYIKSNFFASNKLLVKKSEKQDDIYIYEIEITDETGKDTKTVTKTFVMQLKEGTDFVMSFSVN